MSDAVCGPSNPLQQFKQQTQSDRTLQQDRLANRQHPAHGFRSADPNAGHLDPEFEAFQSGLPAPGLPQYQLYHHAPPAFQQPYQEPSQAPSWAADFQQMSLSSPPPLQHHQATSPSTTDWAQGFREQITHNAPKAQNPSPSPFAFQQRARFGMNGFQSSFAQPAFVPATQFKGKAPVTEQFDEAAFEKAFDMASKDMFDADVTIGSVNEGLNQEQNDASSVEESLEAHGVSKSDVQSMNQVMADRQRGLDEFEPYLQNSLPNQDIIVEENVVDEPMQKEKPAPQQDLRADDDALAATAHELLEKVEHNKTDKFRNSQFLSLMRKLRDREMRVEGDKMVETTASASTSTADLPLNTTSTSTHPRFDNTEQTPAPLDTRPPDYGIPATEQDHDPGRDGEQVVNLLREPGLPGGEPGIPVGADGFGDDIGTSASPPCPSAGPFYADYRTTSQPSSPHSAQPFTQNESLSYMLYGPDGALSV